MRLEFACSSPALADLPLAARPQYECRLCLTLHTNEGNYLAHTQGAGQDGR